VVALSQGAILAQTTAIAKRLQIVDITADWAVSWLPLFHDMGLIGFLLTPASLGGHVTFLRVEDFIKRPSRWIQALSDLRATITGGPPSAYALCARRVKDHELGSYDLSQLRVALVGAEQIMREPIDNFADRFAAAGFRKSSLLPTYGLAENGLAVTMPRQNQEPLFDAVNTDSLHADRFAKPISRSEQSHLKREFVSVGVPLLETEVVIADENGRFLGDRQVGEILVRSPSLMKGYLGRSDLTEQALRDGWLWTGDLGYLAEGNLYITGRKKEVLIVGGQNFYPIDIEQVAGSVRGVRQGKVVAFSHDKPELGTEVIVVLLESRLVESGGRSELRIRVRKALVDAGYPISDVVLARPKTIETTPNGKVKRNDLKKRYMEGEFSRAV
jgi:acyl-CoA synthetase (AMP-forming)/AMP-acid ligase II